MDRDRQDAKPAYAKCYWTLQKVLTRHDPEGIIRMSDGHDGYEEILNTIMPRLEGTCGPGDVAQVLVEELQRWCGTDYGRTAKYLTPCATDMWAVWSPYRQSHRVVE